MELDTKQEEWLMEFLTHTEPALTDTPGRGPMSKFEQDVMRKHRAVAPSQNEQELQGFVKHLMDRDPAAAIEFIYRTIDFDMDLLNKIRNQNRQQKIGM